MRGKGLYRVVPLIGLVVALALSGCRGVDYETRDPWRTEAEEKCLAEKLVQPSAFMEPESEIDGHGACGIAHPFKVAAMESGAIAMQPAATLACPIIGEVDRWLLESVQPAATTWFGEPVVEIHQISAYSCRNMNGQADANISEHAFGNALDVASFKLASGREIVIKNAWRNGAYEERGFLRDILSDACERFSTVLGPGSNAFHYDHFHLDLARRVSGRTYCNPQVARLPHPPMSRGVPMARQPMPQQSPIVATRPPQPRYGDLPLRADAPQPGYQPGAVAAARQPYPSAGQPMNLTPSYPANAPVQSPPPAYRPAEPQPYPAAPNPYRPLPPANVGAKLGGKDEILTGSIGKKESKTKPVAKKSPPAPAPAIAGGDLLSPVSIAEQKSAAKKTPIEEATMKALAR